MANDNTATMRMARHQKTGRVGFFRSFDGTTHADIIGWSAAATTDGLTLTKEEDSTTLDRYATVVLIKGVSNKKVGAFTLAGDTSAVDVTTVGFKPSVVFAASVFNGTTADGNDAVLTFGAIHNSSADVISQCCIAYDSDGSVADSVINTSVNDDCGLRRYLADGASSVKLVWSAFDASGFTVTPSAATGAQVFYLALQLADPDDAYVGIQDSKAGTGTQAYTGTGFTPIVLGLFGNTDTAVNSTSTTPTGGMSYGWTDGTTQQSIVYMDEDALATSNANSRVDQSNILNLRFDDDTVDAVAAYSSFDADGWTLDYSDGSATARKMLAIALSAGSSGATGTISVTESGSDAAALTGVVRVSGSIIASETDSDIAALSGDVYITGTIAATESGGDTAALTGDVLITGTLTVSETGSDTAFINASSAVIATGTIAASESGSDSCSIAGKVYVAGQLSAVDGGLDVFAASGNIYITGTVSATETGSDTAFIDGRTPGTAIPSVSRRTLTAAPRSTTITASPRQYRITA
ncbi:MAG: hypothetical protein WAO76_00505 [Georgfuchsia sp.]